MRSAPDLRLGDAGHAERPVGEVDPVGGHDLGHDGEAERAHREAVLGQPEHGHAHRERDQPAATAMPAGSAAAKGQRALGREEGRGVGADAEEGGVGEREAAHVADHQVVAERQRRRRAR